MDWCDQVIVAVKRNPPLEYRTCVRYCEPMVEGIHKAVDELLAIDVDAVSDVELHNAVIELRTQIERLSGCEAQLLAAWTNRKIWANDGSKAPGARLARETGLSPSTANHIVRRARRLQTMPACSQALASGDLSADRVDLLVRANQPAVSSQFAKDEKLLVSQLRELSFANAVRTVSYWSALADEAESESRADRQLASRYLNVARTVFGNIDIQGVFDPVNGEIYLNELQRLTQELFEADWAEAKAVHGDNTTKEHLKRTSSQRRADAATEMARRSASLTNGLSGRKGGSVTAKPLLTVLVGDKTLERICELASGTVIAPGQVVPLLGQTDIERIVFDGSSRVIEVGRKRLFTGALRRAIEVRDRTCYHQSCDEPAQRCQVDHIIPWSHGGMTEQSNGRLACGFHNRARGPDPPL